MEMVNKKELMNLIKNDFLFLFLGLHPQYSLPAKYNLVFAKEVLKKDGIVGRFICISKD